MLGKWKLITGLLRCFLPSFHPLMKYDALFNFNSSCVWGIKNHAASLVLSTYCLLRHSTKEKEHLLSSNKNRAQQKQNLAINSLSSEDNFFGLSFSLLKILLLKSLLVKWVLAIFDWMFRFLFCRCKLLLRVLLPKKVYGLENLFISRLRWINTFLFIFSGIKTPHNFSAKYVLIKNEISSCWFGVSVVCLYV